MFTNIWLKCFSLIFIWPFKNVMKMLCVCWGHVVKLLLIYYSHKKNLKSTFLLKNMNFYSFVCVFLWNTECLRIKLKPSNCPIFYKVANMISLKVLHIWKVHFVSYLMPKTSFQYNTYLWSYGQNDISTSFPFWSRHYMFIL